MIYISEYDRYGRIICEYKDGTYQVYVHIPFGDHTFFVLEKNKCLKYLEMGI